MYCIRFYSILLYYIILDYIISHFIIRCCHICCVVYLIFLWHYIISHFTIRCCHICCVVYSIFLCHCKLYGTVVYLVKTEDACNPGTAGNCEGGNRLLLGHSHHRHPQGPVSLSVLFGGSKSPSPGVSINRDHQKQNPSKKHPQFTRKLEHAYSHPAADRL